ncbi:MAG: beta-N-acetylhexosaminidase [Pseudomonadota bacterium]
MIGPIMVDVAGFALTDEDREVLGHPLTGGVILFTRNYQNKAQVTALIDEIRSIRSPSLIVAVDHEGGRVQRFREGFSAIPPMREWGRLFARNPDLALQRAEDCGWVMGVELREIGCDVNFAPVVDLDYANSAVIGDRAFDADPVVVTRLARALIGGLHSAGIASCIKHFPGHGFVAGDSHHELPRDTRAWDALRDDLQPFRDLASTARSVMTAHLIAECEADEPVSFSPRWVDGVLREQLRFDGVVFSDDLSMKGADCAGGVVEKVERARAAGCEFMPICNDRAAVLALYAANPAIRVSPRLELLRAQFDVNSRSNSYLKTRRYREFEQYLSTLERENRDA